MTRPHDPTYDAAFVRAFIESALPAMAPARVRPLSRGWDHDVFLVNERWTVRCARNLPAARALAVERELLPWLAPHLPVAIPNIAHEGPIPGGSELRFALQPFLPGTTICDAGPDASPDLRAALAPVLGSFVRALHALDPHQAPAPVAADALGRLDAARRGPEVRAALAGPGLAPITARRLLAALDRAERFDPPSGCRIVHADLHNRNLLVDAGRLSGVIDWVDVCTGDPAIDLAVAFEVLPPEAHPRFFAEYGDVSEATWHWARWRAITHTTAAWSGAQLRRDASFAAACHVALEEMSHL